MAPEQLCDGESLFCHVTTSNVCLRFLEMDQLKVMNEKENDALVLFVFLRKNYEKCICIYTFEVIFLVKQLFFELNAASFWRYISFAHLELKNLKTSA